jgi:type IV pilus assembly protein PilE
MKHRSLRHRTVKPNSLNSGSVKNRSAKRCSTEHHTTKHQAAKHRSTKHQAVKHRSTRHHTAAFTLLELVIALAIIAVLAAFGLPSYQSQVARGHRTDAASALYRAAQYVEWAARGSSGAATLPAGFDQAPQSGTPVYRLQVLAADDANGGYTLEATPIETGPMRDDPCGTFALDATGVRANRAVSGSGRGNMSGAEIAQCWNAR